MVEYGPRFNSQARYELVFQADINLV